MKMFYVKRLFTIQISLYHKPGAVNIVHQRPKRQIEHVEITTVKTSVSIVVSPIKTIVLLLLVNQNDPDIQLETNHLIIYSFNPHTSASSSTLAYLLSSLLLSRTNKQERSKE